MGVPLPQNGTKKVEENSLTVTGQYHSIQSVVQVKANMSFVNVSEFRQ